MDTLDAFEYLNKQHKVIASLCAGARLRHARGEYIQPIEHLAIQICEASDRRDAAALVQLAAAWQAVQR